MKHLFQIGTISGGGCWGQHMCAKSILIVINQIFASRHHLHTMSIAQLLIFHRKLPIKVAHTTNDHPRGKRTLLMIKNREGTLRYLINVQHVHLFLTIFSTYTLLLGTYTFINFEKKFYLHSIFLRLNQYFG